MFPMMCTKPPCRNMLKRRRKPSSGLRLPSSTSTTLERAIAAGVEDGNDGGLGEELRETVAHRQLEQEREHVGAHEHVVHVRGRSATGRRREAGSSARASPRARRATGGEAGHPARDSARWRGPNTAGRRAGAASSAGGDPLDVRANAGQLEAGHGQVVPGARAFVRHVDEAARARDRRAPRTASARSGA